MVDSIEATKIFLENSRFNVDLFLRNAHRIPDYASNRIKVYEGDAKILRIWKVLLNNVDVVKSQQRTETFKRY